MAEALKHAFGKGMIAELAGRLAAVHPAFERAAFERRATKNLEALELTPRARQVSAALGEFLPGDFDEAAAIIIRSLGPQIASGDGNGMDPFKYLPFVFYVAERGLEHFDSAMRAQYELTKRFTAEFSIRAYLEHHEERTLAVLREWTADPDPNVRRLVSEGTRPRLPWAPRLRRFQKDPAPVLALLELLKDDPSLYVRRSVANNLNDIGKDHPALLAQVCRRWMKGASQERRWLVEHALRSAVKRGESAALEVLGHGAAPKVKITRAAASPAKVAIGGNTRIAVTVASTTRERQSLLVDLGVHFVKASGKSSVKVFKLKRIELGPREEATLEKLISLAVHTTRTPHPGRHVFDVRINGAVYEGGSFAVIKARG